MSLMAAYGSTKDRYLDLIHEFPLRPLRTNSDLNAAIAILTRLHDKSELDNAEQDYAEVLSHLIDRYQASSRNRRSFADGEVLQFLLESHDLTPGDLGTAVGISTSTISDVVESKDRLTREQVDRLAAYFKVSPSAFSPTAP